MRCSTLKAGATIADLVRNAARVGRPFSQRLDYEATCQEWCGEARVSRRSTALIRHSVIRTRVPFHFSSSIAKARLQPNTLSGCICTNATVGLNPKTPETIRHS